MTYIGIDVSKDSFVAAYPKKSGYTTKTFLNTTSGVRKFINSLPAECHCVMEATGNYSMLLLYLLQQVYLQRPQCLHLRRHEIPLALLSLEKTFGYVCLYR